MFEELKTKLVETAREAEKRGLCQNKSGNFSCRDKESGLILVTPTGAGRDNLLSDDIVVIDEQGKIVEAKTNLKPTSEYMLHLAAYETRPEMMAVVHTHSRFAVSFAVIGKEIPAIVIEAAHLHLKRRYIPLAPFAQQGTAALGDSVREPLTVADALLLERHGVLTVGNTMQDALLKAMYVEEIAEIYYRTLMLGDDPAPLSETDLCLRYPEK